MRSSAKTTSPPPIVSAGHAEAHRAQAGAFRRTMIAAFAVVLAVVTLNSQASNPTALFQQAVRREALLRQELDATQVGTSGGLLLDRIRVLIGSYEDMARLFATGETTDDSLSHGGVLAADAFAKFGEPADRDSALRLLKSLTSRFPASPLAKQGSVRVRALEGVKPPALVKALDTLVGADLSASATSGREAARRQAALPVDPLTRTDPADPPERVREGGQVGPRRPAAAPTAPSAPTSGPVTPVTLREIRREALPDTLRVTLELDREVSFSDERIEGPPRVFIDLSNTRAADALKDATIPFPDGPVRQVRVGRQLNSRTRVVLDLNGAGSHSVYAVYNPYRIVIDVERAAPAAAAVLPGRTPIVAKPARAPVVNAASASKTPNPPAVSPPPAEAIAADAGKPVPVAPPQNANGSFSLARQLGLGVARIVIDPGHGGHDPGARVNGISEAALVLDVATRLEELLKKQDVEVILTRRTNAYVALEERTSLANRSDADLFLSIHANASTATSARGVETYFLNFAPNPEAEAIAARENSGSAKSMRHLPHIVQAIALNNKLDESRDFATIVQSTLYHELRKSNKSLKNLGVKQAPFMVLVGAEMPSVLAEISFMSNSGEATLLKTERYKQQIAEALLAGIMRYQNSLKKGSPRAE